MPLGLSAAAGPAPEEEEGEGDGARVVPERRSRVPGRLLRWQREAEVKAGSGGSLRHGRRGRIRGYRRLPLLRPSPNDKSTRRHLGEGRAGGKG